MATAESIAIRQQLAAERIAAAGIAFPRVKGPPGIKLAAFLETIADAIDKGDVTINKKDEVSNEREEPTAGAGAGEPGGSEEGHPRVQRRRGRQG
jgi:hypothetical protein